MWIGARHSVADFGISSALPRASSMPCAARRPGSCEPQLHKRETFGHSAASYRLRLVWSQCSGPSLAWSGQRWPQVLECRWSLVRRFRVARWSLQAFFSEVPGPLVRVFLVTASWASDERPTQGQSQRWVGGSWWASGRSVVRLSSKSADLNVMAQELGLVRCGARDPRPGVIQQTT